jgi:hypothetical protein
MAPQRNREEVINTQLALVISQMGVAAEAETIHVHGKERPDVLFELRGLRVILEGKIADHPNAEAVVLEDARKRVRSGIAHIAAAVIYPVALRTASTSRIQDKLRASQLKYRIISETHQTESWFEGDPASLMDSLRHAQEYLTKDDIVEETAKSLSGRLVGVAKLWMGQKGACDRLSSILGIFPPKGEASGKAQLRRETAAKVSALVLANAYIFQEQLASTDGRITSLRRLERDEDTIAATAKHWRWVWENIDYVPIFQLGERILNELPASANSNIATRALLAEAISICSQQAALRHDLMGRIFHWLLHEAKYLGTYYTSVSAATLLLKLSFAARWEQDFTAPAELASFKVADLACGTGTLLMATAQALSDAYIRARAEQGLSLDVKDMTTLHRALMENVLHGYDVLPSAVHLTASTLAMLAPEVAFVRMNLFVMPMGVDHGDPKLGSLDFLGSPEIRTQMALDYSHTETIRAGASFAYAAKASVPKLDLCVMNPPFVRSVGGNLLFGSLPDERGRLQTELKRRVKEIGASATAGLGSVFVALGDKCLKPGGRLAFVLPAALASGEAWARTRELIAERYHLETVIASHDAERPNFSENTELSELLFIARKLREKEKPARTTYINLWRNPRSIHEAIDLAHRLTRLGKPAPIEGAGISAVVGISNKLGEVITAQAPAGAQNWDGALFAQTQLLRTFWLLENGRLWNPLGPSVKVPLVRLDSLGAIGPDRKRIHEGFKLAANEWTPYPAFWNNESEKVLTIAQTPNAQLTAWLESPRGPNYGAHLWERAGDIQVVERLRLNTHRVLAIGLDKEVLGNTWWALKLEALELQRRKALILWLNCSLSVLLVYGRRVITQGPFVQMKQPAWESMPVLDARSLSSSRVARLAKLYDTLSIQGLEALAKLSSDPVRRAIDDAVAKALRLPDLSYVRELLDREPGMNAREIAPWPEEEPVMQEENGEETQDSLPI